MDATWRPTTGLSRLSRELGARRLRESGGVKGDSSCAHGDQAKHGRMDEDGILTKSSEGDAGASDKAARGIESGRDLLAVKIIRQSTCVNIGMLAWGQSKKQ